MNDDTPPPLVDDAPPAEAKPDFFATDERTPVTGNILFDNGSGADVGSDLTVTEINDQGFPAEAPFDFGLFSGAVVTIQSDGSFTYDPNGAFDFLNEGQFITDSFGYTIVDDKGNVSETFVIIEIEGRD